MGFKDLQIKKSYINQGSDNIVDSLLNPALKQAVSYKRSVGFSPHLFLGCLCPRCRVLSETRELFN